MSRWKETISKNVFLSQTDCTNKDIYPKVYIHRQVILKETIDKGKKIHENEPFPEFTPCFCANMRWISREITQFYRNLIEPSGLYTNQYTLLSFLKLEGPLTMNRYAQLSHLDRTTLVRNLKSLEKDGLVSYTNQGTSIKLVQLTPRGREKLMDADPLWDKAQELFRARFDDTEWAYLNRILLKLSKINQAEPELSPAAAFSN